MASKEKKTATELTAMIMDETRCHPVFKDIIDVTISPTKQGQSNWTAEFTFAASRSGPWPVCPEADKLLRLFQNDFELADSNA
jgi:hypothetical protein